MKLDNVEKGKKLCSVLVSFTCKLNKFRKRVNNVVTSKGIQMGIERK